MREKPQPLDAIARARVGERWVVRRRLPDGSATDVIGWVEQVDPSEVSLFTLHGTVARLPASEIILARRAPAAPGGPDPLRTSAEDLERYVLPSWLALSEPLGQWTLRAGAGFTGRANSCLAVGDPGMPIADAAARVMRFSAAHAIEPCVQVIAGSDTEAELRKLGWEDVYLETDVLVCRLSTFLGDSLPDPSVEISEVPSEQWMEACQRSRPNDADPAILKMILVGSPPRVFAGVAADQKRMVAIGRGHVSGPWLGLSSIWTDNDHRRRGLAGKIMMALGHWGARQGARYSYIEVGRGEDQLSTICVRLGFIVHHQCRFLTRPSAAS
jgi:N-acetylglutamate synthase